MMDFCISHLYNNQRKRNLLKEVFYKVEDGDKKELFCFDVSSCGNLVVVCSKYHLQFFNVSTGTLLFKYAYAYAYEHEKREEQQCPSNTSVVNIYKRENRVDVNEININLDNNKQCVPLPLNKKDVINKNNENGENKKTMDTKDANVTTLFTEIGTENQSNSLEQNLKEKLNNDIKVINKEQIPMDNIMENDSNTKNKRKTDFLKNCDEHREIKKVKKLFDGNEKGRKNNSLKTNTIKNSILKTSIVDNTTDEKCLIEIRFIKKDKYLLGVSRRYLHIYKIGTFSIKRIIYIDLFHLSLGIETVISDKLFYPCFFSEYFFFLYKGRKGPTEQNEKIGDKDKEHSDKNEFGKHVNEMTLDEKLIDIIFENKKKKKKIEHNNEEERKKGGLFNLNHKHCFKELYDIYTHLHFEKNRALPPYEIKLIDFKKSVHLEGKETNMNIYVLDIIICPIEQIPYVSRVYVMRKTSKINKTLAWNCKKKAKIFDREIEMKMERSKQEKEIYNKHDDETSEFIVDINNTHPLISVMLLDIMLQENKKEAASPLKKKNVSKSKSKPKYEAGKKWKKKTKTISVEKNTLNTEHDESKKTEVPVYDKIQSNNGEGENKKREMSDLQEELNKNFKKTDTYDEYYEEEAKNCTDYKKEKEYIRQKPKKENQTNSMYLRMKSNDAKIEFINLHKFYEKYKHNNNIIKKLLIHHFPVCIFKNKCKTRIRELPGVFNIYDNLDKLLWKLNSDNKQEDFQDKSKTIDKKNILDNVVDYSNVEKIEKKRNEHTEDQENYFKKENDYYLFDYSNKKRVNYGAYPKDLLKGISYFKKLNKHKRVDRNKNYIFVGSYSYIYVFEQYYIKCEDTLFENEDEVERERNVMIRRKKEERNMAVTTYDESKEEREDESNIKKIINLTGKNKKEEEFFVVQKELEIITNNFYNVQKDFFKKFKKMIFKNKIQLKYVFKICIGKATPLEILIREKGNILCARACEKVFLFKITYGYKGYDHKYEGNEFLAITQNKDTSKRDISSNIEKDKVENEEMEKKVTSKENKQKEKNIEGGEKDIKGLTDILNENNKIKNAKEKYESERKDENERIEKRDNVSENHVNNSNLDEMKRSELINVKYNNPYKEKEQKTEEEKDRENREVKEKENGEKKTQEEKEKECLNMYTYSYIEQMCLYYTIHNPMEKETMHSCCFSEDIYQSYFLLVTNKEDAVTLYLYDLQNMDIQKAVKIDVTMFNGFKLMKWIKNLNMLIILTNIGREVLILKNEYINNWSLFICDFELVENNIEIIEDESEFDRIEIVKPKNKNINDKIWKYLILYFNIYIKNKICIQNILHPYSFFPFMYTNYFHQVNDYFFYETFYDKKEKEAETHSFQELFIEKKKKKKKIKKRINLNKQDKKISKIVDKMDRYLNKEIKDKENVFDHFESVGHTTYSVEILTPSISHYLYYKNIINFFVQN